MFLFNVLGLCLCFMSSSVIQEKIYEYRDEDDNRFQSATLLTFVKNFMAFVLSRTVVYIEGNDRKPLGGKAAICSALIRLFGAVFSLYSLNFISYPHRLIGRCMKIFPIFMTDLLFNNKETSLKRFLSVVVTISGVLLYSSNSIFDSDGFIGLLFISLSLFMDGALSVAQTKMLAGMNDDRPTPVETMIYMSSWQSALCFVLVLFSMNEKGGFLFCMENPFIFYMIIAISMVESVGQLFLYRILVNNGTFRTAFVSTLRKFATILLSIVVFHHVLMPIQWVGLVTVFGGGFIDLFDVQDRSYSKVQVEDSDTGSESEIELGPL